MPGPLKNHRWEKFSLGMVEGKTHTQAGVDAGFSPKSIATNTSKLLKRPEIIARIAELKEISTRNTTYTVAEWRETTQRILKDCLIAGDKANALKAQEQLARHLGAYDADHHRYHHSDHDAWLMAALAENEGDIVGPDTVQ